mmetsp:Transcript_11960/g.21448  ORF Transcript_11960/g.21448 Transcript_11960/m.21448 type:complete len:201 (-) Transcript_11960:199-801(-)
MATICVVMLSLSYSIRYWMKWKSLSRARPSSHQDDSTWSSGARSNFPSRNSLGARPNMVQTARMISLTPVGGFLRTLSSAIEALSIFLSIFMAKSRGGITLFNASSHSARNLSHSRTDASASASAGCRRCNVASASDFSWVMRRRSSSTSARERSSCGAMAAICSRSKESFSCISVILETPKTYLSQATFTDALRDGART